MFYLFEGKRKFNTKPFNYQDLIHISLSISYRNLMLEQDNNLYLMSLSVLITCLLHNVWMLEGEVICFKSHLGDHCWNQIQCFLFVCFLFRVAFI